MQGHHRTPAELIMMSGMETVQDVGPLCLRDLNPSLVLAATAQSKIIPEGCWDSVCTEELQVQPLTMLDMAGLSLAGSARAVQAVAMKHVVCVFLAGKVSHHHGVQVASCQEMEREEQCPASICSMARGSCRLGGMQG